MALRFGSGLPQGTSLEQDETTGGTVQTAAASPSLFHAEVLPENEAVSRINLYGGALKGDLEALYGFLEKSIGPQQLSRGYYFRYVHMDALFAEYYEDLRARMGRGVPGARFRPLLAQCLSFLREHQIIEVLPVLQATEQSQALYCADYVLMQQAVGSALSTAAFRERGLTDSAEAAARVIGRSDPAVLAEIERRLINRDPDFLEGFPYFRLRVAYRSAWHAPLDETHGYFQDMPRFKEEVCLLPLYARLMSEGKLFFESRLEGIKKLGGKFPLAWPTADPNPERLVALHTKMRDLLAGHILGLGAAADGKGPPELSYQANTASGFQALCQSFLDSGARTPSASVAHNLGVQTLQQARGLLLKPDDRMRPDHRFARNLLVTIIMHTETVNRFEQRQVSRRDEDRLKECVQTIARAAPPFVDVHALVRTKEPEETSRRQLLDQVLKHDQIRAADHLRKMTFGSERVVLAFHMLRLNDVFWFSSRAADSGDFSWHMMLERRFGTQEHPEKLEPQLRDEVYGAYLATRDAFFVSTLPWYRRLFFTLGFSKNVPPDEVNRAVRAETAGIDEEVLAIDTRDKRVEVKKKREELARPRAEPPSSEPEQEDLSAGVPVDVRVAAGSTPASPSGAGAPPAGRGAARSSPGTEAGAKTAKPSPAPARAPAAGGVGNATGVAGRADAVRGGGDGRRATVPPAAAQGQTPGGPQKAAPPSPRVAPGPQVPASEPEVSDEPLGDEQLGSLLGVEVTDKLQKPRLSREELTQMTHELAAAPVSREIDDRTWEQALGKEAREETRREVPQEQQRSAQPTGKGWEQELIRAGSKVGVDLTEKARLERQTVAAARHTEKERKKQERQGRAKQKAGQRKSAQAQRHAAAAAAGGAAAAGTSRKHSVIVSVPIDFSASGQPDEILFKKQFFKDPEFRRGMAQFYESEASRATSAAEKKYYGFLQAAMEENYAQFL